MARKLVLMKGGNGKPVSLPGNLADGLVKMRKASYYEDPKAKAKAEPKRQTYSTRHLIADKPASAIQEPEADSPSTWTREGLLTKTNAQLKDIGAAHGVEFDANETKADLVSKLMRYRYTAAARQAKT